MQERNDLPPRVHSIQFASKILIRNTLLFLQFCMDIEFFSFFFRPQTERKMPLPLGHYESMKWVDACIGCNV